MKKFCTRCGTGLQEGARFCVKCGAPVAGSAGAAESPELPERVLKQKERSRRSATVNQHRSVRRPKKARNGKALCIVLSVLLVLEAAAVALFGWPGFAVDAEKTKPPSVLNSNTFTVQEGQTRVENDNGAVLDFGCLLDSGEEITVEEVKPAPVDSDVEIYAYNFELSSGQPDGAIELTIPYDDAGLSEEEELLSVCGKYLNGQTGQWEDVFYTVDTQADEVHIITDHLSTYSAFKIMNPDKRSAYIRDVNVYAAYMTLDQADALLKTYAAQGPTWREDIVGCYLSATGTLEYFIESNMHTLLTLGGAYDDLIKTQFQKTMTGLGIATACAQFASDAYNNGLTSRQTAMSAMKSTLSIAINFATEPIQLAYLGVGVIDLALTEVSAYAIDTRYESTKNMYNEYYRREAISRTVGDWRKLFQKIYRENAADPQAALAMMSAEVDRYVQEYWEVAGDDWESWIDSYDKNAPLSKYPWPNSDDRSNISNTYKQELYSYLQSVWHTISRDIYFDGLIAREKELNEMARLLNSWYAITIIEKVREGENPKWAGCYARLAPLAGSADERAWTGKLNDKGGGTIKFTLLAHQRAGFPMTLELYETLDDVREGKVAMTVAVKPFTQEEQIIYLQTEERYLLYQDTFEAGVYHGGLTIEEHYEKHGFVRNDYATLQAYKEASGYVVTMEGKGSDAVLTVLDAPQSRREHPLYKIGTGGIPGTLDAAGNTFTASYADGETIQIDFGSNTAYLDGPYTMRLFDDYSRESGGLQNGLRYGIEPYD